MHYISFKQPALHGSTTVVDRNTKTLKMEFAYLLMYPFFVTFGAIDGGCGRFLAYRMGTTIKKRTNNTLIASNRHSRQKNNHSWYHSRFHPLSPSSSFFYITLRISVI